MFIWESYKPSPQTLWTTLVCRYPYCSINSLLTWVAEPKACPKSMPTISPDFKFTMKFDKCLSPIPSKYWHTLSMAWLRIQWQRRVWNASGLVLIFWNERLRKINKEGLYMWVSTSYCHDLFIYNLLFLLCAHFQMSITIVMHYLILRPVHKVAETWLLFTRHIAIFFKKTKSNQ